MSERVWPNGPLVIDPVDQEAAGMGADYRTLSVGGKHVAVVESESNLTTEAEIADFAELIVRAVNSHQALVDALKDIAHLFELNVTSIRPRFPVGEAALKAARAALALAGVKP